MATTTAPETDRLARASQDSGRRGIVALFVLLAALCLDGGCERAMVAGSGAEREWWKVRKNGMDQWMDARSPEWQNIQALEPQTKETQACNSNRTIVSGGIDSFASPST